MSGAADHGKFALGFGSFWQLLTYPQERTENDYY